MKTNKQNQKSKPQTKNQNQNYNQGIKAVLFWSARFVFWSARFFGPRVCFFGPRVFFGPRFFCLFFFGPRVCYFLVRASCLLWSARRFPGYSQSSNSCCARVRLFVQADAPERARGRAQPRRTNAPCGRAARPRQTAAGEQVSRDGGRRATRDARGRGGDDGRTPTANANVTSGPWRQA